MSMNGLRDGFNPPGRTMQEHTRVFLAVAGQQQAFHRPTAVVQIVSQIAHFRGSSRETVNQHSRPAAAAGQEERLVFGRIEQPQIRHHHFARRSQGVKQIKYEEKRSLRGDSPAGSPPGKIVLSEGVSQCEPAGNID